MAVAVVVVPEVEDTKVPGVVTGDPQGLCGDGEVKREAMLSEASEKMLLTVVFTPLARDSAETRIALGARANTEFTFVLTPSAKD